MEMEPAIRNISDTALWVAMFRAQETERPDALFRDPYASRLAGERGRQILANVPMDHAWALVIRTYLFDRVITGRLQAGVPTVLNLAAGLDARPYRMELPADLHWVEVDLPELITHKEQLLAADTPRCRLERIAMDLSDGAARRELFSRLGGALVISEGLLLYLSEDQVGDLARDLANAGAAYWLIDLAAPALLQYLQSTTGRSTAEAGAPMHFAPKERLGFFERFGWTSAEVHPVIGAALENGRFPREFLASLPTPPPTAAVEYWSGVCLLRRA
jgi:methyltransferase (TIGR00027 family)